MAIVFFERQDFTANALQLDEKSCIKNFIILQSFQTLETHLWSHVSSLLLRVWTSDVQYQQRQYYRKAGRAVVVGEMGAWVRACGGLDAVRTATRGRGARTVVVVVGPAAGELPEERLGAISRQAGIDKKCGTGTSMCANAAQSASTKARAPPHCFDLTQNYPINL